ncbi:PIN domain-like protein [Calocera viscosa TUFC12733]|uniref:PIN domain-like protein n=1 Tax=Calocera viscosa (strain TUFC12733) TaxID=1330018 RepID=A0A167L833_CALVF|nr:PIN domain-like protein [Calocera viscosa TUFC12733]
MGIKGLLPLLGDIREDVHLSAVSGKTYAIDGYSWLHKGAWGCAEQLAKGERTVKYVDYFMGRIRLMRYHGVEPFVVFDGGPLPAKRGTEEERSRQDALTKARELLAKGKASQAREFYVKALDITPEHALQVIKALKSETVQYIVAPYEADAQMAYLESAALVDGIITEDSDLLVFGCRDVLFKLDTDGNCHRIRREMLTRCKEASFVGWGEKEFRWMAMLSGCDYLPSISGMGLKTAHRLLRQWKTVDRVVQHVRREGKMKVPLRYQEEFEMAELAFVYQRVYCPLEQKLVHLNTKTWELDWNDAKEAYVGEDLDTKIAQGIASGEICPITREPLKDINPWYKPGEIKKVRNQ